MMVRSKVTVSVSVPHNNIEQAVKIMNYTNNLIYTEYNVFNSIHFYNYLFLYK